MKDRSLAQTRSFSLTTASTRNYTRVHQSSRSPSIKSTKNTCSDRHSPRPAQRQHFRLVLILSCLTIQVFLPVLAHASAQIVSKTIVGSPVTGSQRLIQCPLVSQGIYIGPGYRTCKTTIHCRPVPLRTHGQCLHCALWTESSLTCPVSTKGWGSAKISKTPRSKTPRWLLAEKTISQSARSLHHFVE